MLKENSIRKSLLAERYVLENISQLFPQYELVKANEPLQSGRSVDFHCKDRLGNDVFIEVKASRIDKKYLGQILDHYSAIANYTRKTKGKFKLILVGDKIDHALRNALKNLNISFIRLDELGFSYERMLKAERNRKLRTLSPTEAMLVADWEARHTQIISTDMLIRKLRCNRNYANKLLRKLEKKRWLSQIASGVYSFIPAEYGYEERFPRMNPFLIGSVLVHPYYFGYSTANSHYGFTSQMPATYYIVTTEKRQPYKWRNIRFQFVTLSSKKFFGFKEVKMFGVKINIADPEKALIDAIDKMRYCGGIEEVTSVIQRGLKNVNKHRLVEYVLRIDSYAIYQRLGFIIDFLCEHRLAKFPSQLRTKLLHNIGKSPIYLDVSRPKKGRYVKEWNVMQNITEKDLLSEIEIR